MAQVRQTLLILILAGALIECVSGTIPKFFPDDPIQAVPPPLPVKKPAKQQINEAFDFFVQSWNDERRPPSPAGAINTIGEVPNSDWFTNRHGFHRMSRNELQLGGSKKVPVPPFTVTSGKEEGITPGFVMQDSEGKRYFVKCDPHSNPGLASGADVIVSKFLYAIGYNTPKNEILDLKLSDLRLSDTATIALRNGRSRTMTWGDVKDSVKLAAHKKDGSFRVVASLAIEGHGIGPFLFEGTRWDDPNDIVPHEDRRDLRGLYVFSAWLNNTDAKAGNSLDTVVEQKGIHFIRHYLLDFGSALGSDGDAPKDPRFGYDYMLPSIPDQLKRAFTFGLVPAPWERVHYPYLPSIGNIESQLFDPDDWKPDYPNPAFLSRQPDDDFWAAKIVMAFTDDDIRAIVETAKFSDPAAAEYLITTLAQRRDKILRTFFSKLLPLDHFRIENGELLFDDLAVNNGFVPARNYEVRWYRFDNFTQKTDYITGPSTRLPDEAAQALTASYFSVVISAPSSQLKPATIYLRKDRSEFKLVGVDRAW
jgi:hypothetical protein